MPSGVGPTVTVFTTRIGLARISIKLIESASPPLAPILATTATSPLPVVSIWYGRKPANRSRLVYSTLLPSTERTEMRLSESRVTSAVLPSRENTTWLGPDLASPSAILPAGVSVLPLIVNTETVPSLRLATSASVAARLIETPAAPAPACSVATTFGGEGFRSITVNLSSATALVGSAGSIFIAPVTSAKLSSGATATLAGGPTTLAGAGNSATMWGDEPERSMIETVSGNGTFRT